MSIAIFSPKLPLYPSSHSQTKPIVTQKPFLSLKPSKKLNQVRFLVTVSSENGVTVADETPVVEKTVAGSNGSPTVAVADEIAVVAEGKAAVAEEIADVADKAFVSGFKDVRWVDGTWDLKQFAKDGKTDWDAVIDAEVKRRKWNQDTPESSSNDEPVVFDTSIVPWWVWVKRFHLPEAELLNGRAAMVGFFMAYFVDSLTGVGLVDQMGNFFCKTLLFVAVAGVLLVRKNEDIETLKRLLEETTFYDKQWQATWQDEKPSSSGKN